MIRFQVLPIAFVSLLLPTTLSYASVVYSYASDSTTYPATAAGQAVTVKVYLNEILTNSSTSFLTEGSPNGLAGAGFYVLQTSGAGGATISTINANINASNAASDPGFDVGGSGVSISSAVAADHLSARLLESDNGFPGPTGVTTGFGRQVLIGTINLLSGLQGTSTTYTLKTYVNAPISLGGSGQDANTVTYEFNDLDLTNNGGAAPPAYTGGDDSPFKTFSISTTPEPSSLMMMCGLSVGRLLFRRARRKQVRSPS